MIETILFQRLEAQLFFHSRVFAFSSAKFNKCIQNVKIFSPMVKFIVCPLVVDGCSFWTMVLPKYTWINQKVEWNSQLDFLIQIWQIGATFWSMVISTLDTYLSVRLSLNCHTTLPNWSIMWKKWNHYKECDFFRRWDLTSNDLIFLFKI